MKQLARVPVIGKKVEAYGLKNHRRFKAMPIHGTVLQPEFIDGWWYIPIDEDESDIPRHAFKGLDILRAGQYPIVQVMVGHEVPKLLPPPPGESKAEKSRRAWEERKEAAIEVVSSAARAGKTAGNIGLEVGKFGAKATITAAKVAGTLAIGTVALGGWALAKTLETLILIDPALIAVVRDEETGEEVWINVCDWYG